MKRQVVKRKFVIMVVSPAGDKVTDKIRLIPYDAGCENKYLTKLIMHK